MKALSECLVKNRGGGSLAIVKDAGWPVDMCGFEDVVLYLAGELLSAFSVIERSKGRFGCIAGATASRSAAVHSRKQPLHDLANRIAEQPGLESFSESSFFRFLSGSF